MIRFRGEIEPLNVIFILFLCAFFLMYLYRSFTEKTLVLSRNEKIINITAGMSQALVYILYFYFLFLFPSDSILIVIFYNFFGLILVFIDAVIFKTKNNLIEYIILILIVLISLFLLLQTQLLLGKTLENISYLSLYGFIPAIFAALVGLLYKYLSDYKSNSIKDLVHNNLQFLFFRSMGGLILSGIVYMFFLLLSDFRIEMKVLELKLGLLYALFPFLISHLFYSISLYKKASILILSMLMNLSPIITLLSIYYFSGIRYELDIYMLMSIIAILSLSSFLSIYHSKREKII